MTDALTDDQKSAINTRIPAGRMGTPEEIASAVLYLASPEAGYSTGAGAACEWRYGHGLSPAGGA